MIFLVPALLSLHDVGDPLPSPSHKFIHPCSSCKQDQDCRRPCHAYEGLSFVCCNADIIPMGVNCVHNFIDYACSDCRGDEKAEESDLMNRLAKSLTLP